MKKIAYIIPGYRDGVNLRYVHFISSLFRKRAITPVPIKIKWKYRTIDDYMIDFFSQMEFNDNSDIYLFGFSYGAMIALLGASLLHPKKLYLCSLSPYFKEDINDGLNRSERIAIGKKRLADFKSISFDALAKSIKCDTVLFVGEQEPASVQRRTFEAKHILAKAQIHIIENATHDLNNNAYQRMLRRYL